MEKQLFMRACREGGRQIESALAALHRDYGQALWREAWRGMRDPDLARDLLQETLLKAWRACASYRGDAELYPWLVVILRRAVIDALRHRRPEEPLEDDNGQLRGEVETAWTAWREDLASAPAQHLQDRQAEAVFRRCAERFAAEEPGAAEVVRWIAEDGLTPAQVADLIGRSPGATREYLSQCRKKARRYFAEWYALVGRGGPRQEAA